MGELNNIYPGRRYETLSYDFPFLCIPGESTVFYLFLQNALGWNLVEYTHLLAIMLLVHGKNFRTFPSPQHRMLIIIIVVNPISYSFGRVHRHQWNPRFSRFGNRELDGRNSLGKRTGVLLLPTQLAGLRDDHVNE